MAKRKRLTPANPLYLDEGTPLETKSAFSAPARGAPIADVAGQASAVAALDEVTQTLTRAREEGRMVMALPLDQIQMDYLVRDRLARNEDDMAALRASLKDRGQQTPIEVAMLGPDRYGLISGWRRCEALRQLAQETGEARFGTVLALLRKPSESSEAYLAMVEENEIRAGLSYYERARIVAKSVEQDVFETEKAALQSLFRNASRAKRSKIGSFVHLVRALDGELRYPEVIGERMGLALSYALQNDAGVSEKVKQSLLRAKPIRPEMEQAALSAVLSDLQGAKETRVKTAEPSQEKTKTESVPAVFEPVPGISLQTHSDGRLTLSGKRVDAALRDALLTWLSESHSG